MNLLKTKKGQINLLSSYNNTLISVCDIKGNCIYICSTGQLGFKGARKNTAYAAQQVATKISDFLNNNNIEEIIINIKGRGNGREAALQQLLENQKKYKVLKLIDSTPIAFNGCRPKKRRKI